MRFVAVAALLAGCYAPHANPGAPCSPDGECPSGETCIAGLCEAPGGMQTDAPAQQTDARAIDAPPDATPVLGSDGWYPATPVLGVNTSSVETDPTYTSNRLTIVFASDRASPGSFDLYVGTRTEATEPFTVTALTTVNSTGNDRAPELEPTGAYIYFTSDRSGSFAVYQSNQTSPGVWSAPAAVSSLAATNATLSLGVAPDNTESLVIHDNSGADKFLAYSREAPGDNWSDPYEVATLEISNEANNPTLTDEGAVIYLDSGTPAQIYRSTSPDDGMTFTAPVPIGDLNLGTRDAAPFVSSDDNHILFERDGDIYEADRVTP